MVLMVHQVHLVWMELQDRLVQLDLEWLLADPQT
jgi:hypothetical protein